MASQISILRELQPDVIKQRLKDGDFAARNARRRTRAWAPTGPFPAFRPG